MSKTSVDDLFYTEIKKSFGCILESSIEFDKITENITVAIDTDHDKLPEPIRVIIHFDLHIFVLNYLVE